MQEHAEKEEQQASVQNNGRGVAYLLPAWKQG